MIIVEHKHELICHRPPIGLVTHVLKGTNKEIENTTRVERLLRLLVYLQEFRTKKQIAAHLGLSIKSVNRYIHLVLKLGFTVERRMQKYYSFKITNTKQFFKID